jgi:hypothetical protein
MWYYSKIDSSVSRSNWLVLQTRRKTMKRIVNGVLVGAMVLVLAGCATQYRLAPEDEKLMRDALAASQAAATSASQAAASAARAEKAAASAEKSAASADAAASSAQASADRAEAAADKAAKAFELSQQK